MLHSQQRILSRKKGVSGVRTGCGRRCNVVKLCVAAISACAKGEEWQLAVGLVSTMERDTVGGAAAAAAAGAGGDWGMWGVQGNRGVLGLAGRVDSGEGRQG